MKSIFLSYSSRDKHFTKKLAQELSDYGIKVWFDEWEIKVGDSIVEKINSAIRKNDYLGIILSPNSVESPWVKKELSAALMNELEKKYITILPILYKDCKIPPIISDKRYADFRKEFGRGLSGLLIALGIGGSSVLPSSKRIVLDMDHLNCVRLGMETVITAISYYGELNNYDDPTGEEENLLQRYWDLSGWDEKTYLLIQKVLGISEPYELWPKSRQKSIISNVLHLWVNIKKHLRLLKGDEYADSFQYGFSIGLFLLDIHKTSNFDMIVNGIKRYSENLGIRFTITNDFLKKIGIEGALDSPFSQGMITVEYYVKVLASIESKIRKG